MPASSTTRMQNQNRRAIRRHDRRAAATGPIPSTTSAGAVRENSVTGTSTPT